MEICIMQMPAFKLGVLEMKLEIIFLLLSLQLSFPHGRNRSLGIIKKDELSRMINIVSWKMDSGVIW